MKILPLSVALAAFACSTTIGYAQDYIETVEGEVRDYAVTKSGDTLYGEISPLLDSYKTSKNTLVFKPEGGGKLRRLKADEIKSFRFGKKKLASKKSLVYTGESRQVEEKDGLTEVFVYREMDGKIIYWTTYPYATMTGGGFGPGGAGMPVGIYGNERSDRYVQKGNGPMVADKTKNTKVIRAMLEDCPEFKEKVKKMVIALIIDQVKLYNKVCK